MLQFVFFCEKVSVAAMKMETSWFCCWACLLEVDDRDCDMASTPEVEEGIAFGSWDEVFSAGPESLAEREGEGGGVG